MIISDFLIKLDSDNSHFYEATGYFRNEDGDYSHVIITNNLRVYKKVTFIEKIVKIRRCLTRIRKLYYFYLTFGIFWVIIEVINDYKRQYLDIK